MSGRVPDVPSWCLAFSWLQIIYANPCKAPAHIRFARDRGVHLMTFDNEDELHKVRQIPFPAGHMHMVALDLEKPDLCTPYAWRSIQRHQCIFHAPKVIFYRAALDASDPLTRGKP